MANQGVVSELSGVQPPRPCNRPPAADCIARVVELAAETVAVTVAAAAAVAAEVWCMSAVAKLASAETGDVHADDDADRQ